MRCLRRRWARRGESGSLAVEMAMVAPGLLLIFGLIFAYGRSAGIHGTLESGTRDAARSATQARSYDAAQQRAEEVIREAIRNTPQDCQDSLEVRLSPVDDYLPGSPLSVFAECTYDLSDIGLPGAPGDITAESTFTSMLDPFRGIR